MPEHGVPTRPRRAAARVESGPAAAHPRPLRLRQDFTPRQACHAPSAAPDHERPPRGPRARGCRGSVFFMEGVHVLHGSHRGLSLSAPCLLTSLLCLRDGFWRLASSPKVRSLFPFDLGPWCVWAKVTVVTSGQRWQETSQQASKPWQSGRVPHAGEDIHRDGL